VIEPFRNRINENFTGDLALDRKLVEFLVKLRDGSQMIADAANEYLESLAPSEVKDDKPKVPEDTFSILKYEPQKGAKLGDYEVAYKPNNLPDKWSNAFNVLNASNATIQNRYHDKEFSFSYWLYGQDKIYRQKLSKKGEEPSAPST